MSTTAIAIDGPLKGRIVSFDKPPAYIPGAPYEILLKDLPKWHAEAIEPRYYVCIHYNLFGRVVPILSTMATPKPEDLFNALVSSVARAIANEPPWPKAQSEEPDAASVADFPPKGPPYNG